MKRPVRSLCLACALTVAALALASRGTNASAAPPTPEYEESNPGQSATCTKKIVSSPCTSCSEPGVQDIECKPGRDYEDCSNSPYTCPNTALCDQATGGDPCE